MNLEDTIICPDVDACRYAPLMKNIFEPGFSTKKRGWGFGLTLARRIIEEYHHGKIFVKESSAKGTTFRIILKAAE
mgnify:CR=1 FL=1